MNKRTGIIIIGSLLLISLLGQLFEHLNLIRPYEFFTQFWLLGRLGAIGLILIYGSLIFKRLSFLIIFLVVILLAGAAFKILHWPYGDLLLLSGLIGIPAVYTFHFIKKQKKHLLDWLKYSWIVIYCIAAIASIFHLPFSNELSILEAILFIALFIQFVISAFKGNENSSLDRKGQ